MRYFVVFSLMSKCLGVLYTSCHSANNRGYCGLDELCCYGKWQWHRQHLLIFTHYAKLVILGNLDLHDKLRVKKHSNNTNNDDPYMRVTFFHFGQGKVRSKHTQVISHFDIMNMNYMTQLVRRK